MFGAAAAPATSVHFVAPQAIEAGLAERLALNRRLVPVKDVGSVGKADLPLNDAMPAIEIDPDTFTVCIDGEVWEEQPATELPMAQRYFPSDGALMVQAPLATLLALADSRLPTGAHVHSGGVEEAVTGGMVTGPAPARPHWSRPCAGSCAASCRWRC